MPAFRRSIILALSMLLALFVVACGSTPNTSANGSTSSSASATQTGKAADVQNGQGAAQQAAATVNVQQTPSVKASAQSNGTMTGATSSAPQKVLISSRQVKLNGQMTAILTTFDGMSLYERTSDPAPGSSCIGACAKTWPPLLTQGTVISTVGISGMLTVQTTANGRQVEYNGHPLYTFSGDMAPGQINGQGLGGVWQVATVRLQSQHW